MNIYILSFFQCIAFESMTFELPETFFPFTFFSALNIICLDLVIRVQVSVKKIRTVILTRDLFEKTSPVVNVIISEIKIPYSHKKKTREFNEESKHISGSYYFRLRKSSINKMCQPLHFTPILYLYKSEVLVSNFSRFIV